MTRQLVPGPRAHVVGVMGIAKRYDMGQWLARKLLRDWWAEQEAGGPLRVFRVTNKGSKGGHAYYTTETELLRWMPAARDSVLVRKVERLEQDNEFLSRRVDKLTGELAGVVAKLERMNRR